jgi:hypothetical protein
MPETKKQLGAATANKPVKVFRARGVKVSVFENMTKNGDRETKFYKTTTQKVYREGEEWKTTTSLGRDDLPIARHLLQRAWEFILETEATRSNEPTE